jgi:hypothetical protein
VDPARVIRLVQSAPKEFKLDGGDKLRFFQEISVENQLARPRAGGDGALGAKDGAAEPSGT